MPADIKGKAKIFFLSNSDLSLDPKSNLMEGYAKCYLIAKPKYHRLSQPKIYLLETVCVSLVQVTQKAVYARFCYKLSTDQAWLQYIYCNKGK